MGIDFTLAPCFSVEEGIEAVRNLLPQLWIDRSKCARGVEALQDYRYTWDEHLRIFSKRPFHSWSSHGADALRMFATGYDELPDLYAPRPPVQTAFNPYTGKPW
jgi:phage terminase large subunit